MKNIVSRGRVLGRSNSEFARMLEGNEGSKTFTLKSGRQAKFTHTVIMSGEIESRTFVDPAVNGRDQSLLTPESVSDISRTIKLQQFFPAIGREVDGRIEILDGTRRRAACIFNQTKFEILITKDEISLDDARQLAIDIQTAREHTLRELGKRFEIMYDKGMTKEEIARAENISPAKVTRAFQAAAVPDEMIAVFPAVNELSLTDYQALLQIAEDAKTKGVSVSELAEKVSSRIAEYESTNVDKTKIMAIYKDESRNLKPTPVKSVETEKLREFSDRRQYARKKTDAKKRLVIYEFARIPPTVQAELDEAIKKIMDKFPTAD
ncbi:TPA: ParB/RepB/Spo0J family partition protein [Escherichia coli]|nr:ParB/RepB/Spo0J family partition protein [Escherichia coli]